MNPTFQRTATALGALAAFAAPALAAVDSASSVILTPNLVSGGPFTATLGQTAFTNLGLQGVGKIDAAFRDGFGETFGSVSALQIGNWRREGGAYAGTFYTLPDRGYNTGTYFSFYESRIQQLNFTFTPYAGAGPVAPTQINPLYVGGTKLSYLADGAFHTTTGADPGSSVATLLGQPVPFTPTQTLANGGTASVNRLAVDAEGLIMRPDGSGYVSDEYGPYVYHFNSSKQITGVLPLPAALIPHTPAGTVNFQSLNPPTDGRRNNQGMEGIALSPDGKKLYALMQSAAIQDSTGSQQTRLNTRLLVYDVSSGPIPSGVSAEYVLQLPTLDQDGTGPNPDRTAAQSEIVALGDGRLLVLSRDGLGVGAGGSPVFKSVLLVDLNAGHPTDIVSNAAANAEGGQISPGGVLSPAITELSWVEAVNMLNTTDLAKFGFGLNTLSEKWEGMALVPALDAEHPYDYFLFIGNDNDFLTRSGRMLQADGSFFDYDAGISNDTVFFAYRVRIAPVPEPQTWAMLAAGLGLVGWFVARRR